MTPTIGGTFQQYYWISSMTIRTVLTHGSGVRRPPRHDQDPRTTRVGGRILRRRGENPEKVHTRDGGPKGPVGLGPDGGSGLDGVGSGVGDGVGTSDRETCVTTSQDGPLDPKSAPSFSLPDPFPHPDTNPGPNPQKYPLSTRTRVLDKPPLLSWTSSLLYPSSPRSGLTIEDGKHNGITLHPTRPLPLHTP